MLSEWRSVSLWRLAVHTLAFRSISPIDQWQNSNKSAHDINSDSDGDTLTRIHHGVWFHCLGKHLQNEHVQFVRWKSAENHYRAAMQSAANGTAKSVFRCFVRCRRRRRCAWSECELFYRFSPEINKLPERSTLHFTANKNWNIIKSLFEEISQRQLSDENKHTCPHTHTHTARTVKPGCGLTLCMSVIFSWFSITYFDWIRIFTLGANYNAKQFHFAVLPLHVIIHFIFVNRDRQRSADQTGERCTFAASQFVWQEWKIINYNHVVGNSESQLCSWEDRWEDRIDRGVCGAYGR